MAPLPDDVATAEALQSPRIGRAPGASSSSGTAVLSSCHRAPPPAGYSDKVYREDPDGYFATVQGYGATRGQGAGSGVMSRTLSSCASAVASAVSDLEHHTRTMASNTMQTVQGLTGFGRYGGASWAGEAAEGRSEYAVPVPWELQFASGLLHIIVGPTKFASGILAGVAVVESAVVANLDLTLETSPLSVLYLYAPAASYYYAAFLVIAWTALIGIAASITMRTRGTHYLVLPWQPILDHVLLLLYLIIMAVTYSNRQEAFSLQSPFYGNNTPSYSFADHAIGVNTTGPVDNPYFLGMSSLWRSHAASLIARQALSFLAALLSFAPTADEAFLHYHHRIPKANPPLTPHTLQLNGFVDGGFSMGLGFWSVRHSLLTHRLALRAPDGGGPLAAVSHRAMSRGRYAGCVFFIVLCLAVDVACQYVYAAGQVWAKILKSGDDYMDELLGGIYMMVGSIAARVLMFTALFMMLVGTETYRLGRYAVFCTDFGGAVMYGVISSGFAFFLGLFYIIRIAECHTCENQGFTFYEDAAGIAFTVFQVLHFVFATVWFVKLIAALRRLARAHYYMHPDIAYQSDLARRNAAVTPAPHPPSGYR